MSDCPHPIESRAFRENAYLEWMTCLSCGARWSQTKGVDDIQIKKELPTIQPKSAPPCPGCGKTMRLQQTAKKTETLFGCSRFPLCKRVVHVPPITGSPASQSVCTFVCLAEPPSESQAVQTDVESVSSEDSFSMWHVPTATQPEQESLLEQLPSLSSSGITSQKALKAIVEMFLDQQQKLKVASQNVANHDAEGVNRAGLLQRALVWDHKTSVNDDLCGKLPFDILEMSVCHLVS